MDGWLRIGAAVAATAMTATLGIAQEKRISRSNLPPAVEKTVAAEAAHATVRGFSEERENGHTYYEAELTVDGHSRDVLMDGQGNVVEVEEQVALDALPKEVRAGLMSQVGNGQILRVESITKHEKIVAYEAQVKTGSKRSEIQVGPDGKRLDHEE
jgi:hypothetical protein